eukprot:4900524-Pleurochrysis_carterae.AAC.2
MRAQMPSGAHSCNYLFFQPRMRSGVSAQVDAHGQLETQIVHHVAVHANTRDTVQAHEMVRICSCLHPRSRTNARPPELERLHAPTPVHQVQARAPSPTPGQEPMCAHARTRPRLDTRGRHAQSHAQYATGEWRAMLYSRSFVAPAQGPARTPNRLS